MLVSGIFKIELGTIANDGGCATTFAALGRTREGTLSIDTTDDQTNDIKVEEQDEPVLQTISSKGTLDVKWSMVDWDTDVMTALFGGSVVSGQWQAPDQSPTVEKSLRITPKDGKPFIFPRVKVSAKINYNASDKLFMLELTCRKLKPEKAGEPGLMWGEEI